MDPLTVAVYVILFVTGLCMGSFLNVLADRLSNDMPITGRSRCDTCKKQLTWRELIPVVSYFVQGGACKNCKTKLSWYYPFSEFLTGCLYVAVWHFFPVAFFREQFPNLTNIFYEGSAYSADVLLVKALVLAIISCFIVIYIADMKYFIIPDEIQVAIAIFSGLLFFVGDIQWVLIGERVLAALVVMLPMLAVFLVTRGMGMGFGDVKLAANFGLLLGIKFGLVALYWSFMAGTAVGVVLLALRKKGVRSKVPFGPFMLLGAIVTVVYYEKLSYFLRYYYNL
jgi:prepilin signal peptidase PulO-like enzyme (type II secretory pathway)